METNLFEIKVRKGTIKVPSIRINNKTVVVTGKAIKMATVHDEEWLEGQGVDEPEMFIAKMKEANLKADIFTFTQKIPDIVPRYQYHLEWDNVAAIPIISFKDWWEKRLPQVTRKSIRRGGKRGVIAKVVEFNDELVRGIIEIHNDTPIRQGMPFAYMGMEFEDVKEGYGTYLDKSTFLGAYLGSELIGIIKLVHVGREIASIMQILTMTRHYDKRPTNILIAKAVEVCEEKGIPFLVYGKYVYGNKTDSSLTEFKRRNGFEKVDFPRYYIPLTLKGRIIIKLKLHLGLLGILPSGVISLLRDLRSRYIRIRLSLPGLGKRLPDNSQNTDAAGEGD